MRSPLIFCKTCAIISYVQYGLVAQLGERTVRIREVRGFDPLRVHQKIDKLLTKLVDFTFLEFAFFMFYPFSVD